MPPKTIAVAIAWPMNDRGVRPVKEWISFFILAVRRAVWLRFNYRFRAASDYLARPPLRLDIRPNAIFAGDNNRSLFQLDC